VWPKTRGEIANVLNKLPNWMAEAEEEPFVEAWGVKYDKAVDCLIKDRDALLAFFPSRPSIGSICARPFATIRHRTVRSKGCLSNKTALAMIFKLAEAAERCWRFRMRDRSATDDSGAPGAQKENGPTKRSDHFGVSAGQD
jgi:putative transposase